MVGIEVDRSGTVGVMPDDQFELRVDERGRVTIPKQMRSDAGDPSHFLATLDGDEITLTPARVVPDTEG